MEDWQSNNGVDAFNPRYPGLGLNQGRTDVEDSVLNGACIHSLQWEGEREGERSMAMAGARSPSLSHTHTHLLSVLSPSSDLGYKLHLSIPSTLPHSHSSLILFVDWDSAKVVNNGLFEGRIGFCVSFIILPLQIKPLTMKARKGAWCRGMGLYVQCWCFWQANPVHLRFLQYFPS